MWLTLHTFVDERRAISMYNQRNASSFVGKHNFLCLQPTSIIKNALTTNFIYDWQTKVIHVKFGVYTSLAIDALSVVNSCYVTVVVQNETFF